MKMDWKSDGRGGHYCDDCDGAVAHVELGIRGKRWEVDIQSDKKWSFQYHKSFKKKGKAKRCAELWLLRLV